MIIIGIIDLTRSVMTIPAEIYTQYTWLVGPISWICKTKIFFNTVSITYSTCILLLIGIDRFRKACRPHGRQIRPKLALKISIGLGILAVIWSVPALIFCGPQTFTMHHAQSSFNVTICLKDNTYINTMWPFLLLNILYAGPTCVTMIITLVLYALIAKTIFKRTKKKRGIRTITATIKTEIENEGGTEDSVEGLSDIGNDACVLETEDCTNGTSSRSDSEVDNSEDNRIRLSTVSYIRNNVDIDAGSTKTEPISASNDRDYVNANVGPSSPTDISDVNSSTTTPNNESYVNVNVGSAAPNRGYVNVKVGPSSPAFLFGFPLIDVKTLRDRPLKQSYTFKKPVSNLYSRASRRRQRRRMRRNTLIMFTLTLCFVVTMLIYFILAIHLSDTEKFFDGQALWQAVLAMFFLRLYYFNILINIVVYGLLDPRFRRAVRKAGRRMSMIGSITNVNRRHRRR